MTPLERRGMAAILLSVSLATLDTAIANTALPAIAADLHATPAASVWIINAYQLAMVATLLPLAALGGILGHRRVYLAGLIVFRRVGGLRVLVVAADARRRAPAARPGRRRDHERQRGAHQRDLSAASARRGVGLNALVVGIAFAVGPTVASIVLSLGTWPWLFAVNLPVGIFALMIAWRSLPQTKRAAHGFDRVAALLNVVTFASLIFALGEAAQRASAQIVLASFGIALVAGALLLRRERGHPAPMLPVDLFRRPMFALSTMTAVCSFAAQGLAFVSLPFFFESVLGRSQVETGFLMTPWSALVAVMAPIAGRMSDRHSPGLLGGVGLAILCVGMVSLAMLPAEPHALEICIRMAICGAGFGFFQSPNLKAFMSSAPRERSGGASGTIATSRLIGQATGAALVALCFSIAGKHGPTLALSLGAAFAGAGSVASGLRLVTREPSQAASEKIAVEPSRKA